jgi:hypothetical protein
MRHAHCQDSDLKMEKDLDVREEALFVLIGFNWVPAPQLVSVSNKNARWSWAARVVTK